MIEAVGVFALMGGLFGSALAVAAQKLHVHVDEKEARILELLPGVNCGACGFPGCAGMAAAIAENRAEASSCVVVKSETVKEISIIAGQEVAPQAERRIVRLKCSCPLSETVEKYDYQGIRDCHLAVNLFKGPRSCNYGCFGFGSCVRVCPFGALKIGADGMPDVDYALCTGCGACVRDCPQFLLYLEKSSQEILLGCNNLDRGRQAKDVCRTACVSCGLCAKNCPVQAVSMITYKNGGSLPRINSEKCTQCGICTEKCPVKCIKRYLPIKCAASPPSKPPETGCATCGACAGN